MTLVKATLQTPDGDARIIADAEADQSQPVLLTVETRAMGLSALDAITLGRFLIEAGASVIAAREDEEA